MKTFPEALSSVLKTRQLSASVAASALGYSSKTALLRILNGESKPSSYRKCLDAAKASDALSLTQEEIDQLEHSLTISTLGKKVYLVNSMLKNLMRPMPIDDTPAPQRIEGLRSLSTMEELLSHLLQLNNIEIDIFGRCPISLLGRLARLAQEESVCGIHHILSIKSDDPEDYAAIGDASQIIFSPKYSLYIHINRKDDVSGWSFHSGIIFITGLSASGTRQSYMLTPLKGDVYYALHESSAAFYRLKERIKEDTREFIRPIKTNKNKSDLPFPLDYIHFIDTYRKIEHNREILTLKPDIPFYCISPDIHLPMLLENLPSSAQKTVPPEFIRLYDIQKARYSNLFTKNKDSHFILSREAMERLARTGRREDHFHLLRPYTPQERVSIFTALMENMQAHPRFNIWFLRNHFVSVDKEITSYENFGMSIVNAGTSWNINDDHQEILLESRFLVSCFSEFLIHQILRHDVYSREESISILRELIDIAKSCE